MRIKVALLLAILFVHTIGNAATSQMGPALVETVEIVSDEAMTYYKLKVKIRDNEPREFHISSSDTQRFDYLKSLQAQALSAMNSGKKVTLTVKDNFYLRGIIISD